MCNLMGKTSVQITKQQTKKDFQVFILGYIFCAGRWLRCCATNQKVAGSIPAGVIGFSLT